MNRYMPFLLLCLATGCAHKAVVSDWYGNNPKQFPPSENVEVFRTQAPTRPYIELAELQVDDRAGNRTAELVAKAKEIGADAIILTGSKGGRTIYAPVGGMMVGRQLTQTGAIAIKYKEQQ